MVEFTVLQDEPPRDSVEQRRLVVTTISGTISIQGLANACAISERQTFVSEPLIQDQRWKLQIRLTEGSEGYVSCFLQSCAQITPKILRVIGFKLRVGNSILAQGESDIMATQPRPNHLWGKFEFAKPILANHPALRVEGDDVVELDYVIKEYPAGLGTLQVQPLERSLGIELLRAYRFLFDDPNTADVRFICPTSREGGSPRYIYAHKAILGCLSDYFKRMFSSGFSEGSDSEEIPLSTTTEMALDQDSDCEDAEIEEGLYREGLTVPSTSNGGSLNGRRYKSVRVVDYAYRTYRALLYYLYTGSLRFAPLTSTYVREKSAASAQNIPIGFPSKLQYCQDNAVCVSLVDDDSDQAPWTSAKSMYALCEKIDMEQLKAAARNHIKKSLTTGNIMSEMFSTFTATYDEIYELELEYIKTNWAQVRSLPDFEEQAKHLLLSGDSYNAKVFLAIMNSV